MSPNCGCISGDELPVISTIPGPRGPAGSAGTGGGSGAAGRNSYGTTTSSFVMPAAASSVMVFIDHTDWCAVGQSIFIAAAGYFLIAAIVSPTALTVTAQNVPSNTAAGTTIAAGQRVTAGGLPHIDGTALADLDARVYVLESTPGGARTFYSSTAPSGPGLIPGDLWFDLAHNRKPFRWDGTGWVDMSDARVSGLVSDVSTLAAGITTLTTSTDALKQEYVLAVVGSGSSKRVAGFRVTVPGGGTDPTEFVVQADKFVILGSDGTGRASPFYVDGGVTYIREAVIPSLQAGKITAGDIQSVNIGYAGRLFHTADTHDPKHYFRAVEFATAVTPSKVFAVGNVLGGGYSHATPVLAYGPLHVAWTSGTVTACPDATGKVRVIVQGRVPDYSGNLLVYGQKNNEVPFALAAIESPPGGTAVISCSREISGFGPTDSLQIFVAPADGSGAVASSVTCRVELDVTLFNW